MAKHHDPSLIEMVREPQPGILINDPVLAMGGDYILNVGPRRTAACRRRT